jgi:holo-[acyl-carrier protein] synthase
MIIGLGIDLVDVLDLQSDLDQQKEKLLHRLFTPIELDYCSSQADPYQSFAGTLAAKEATMKAFGTGWTDDVDWQDIEVVREPSGKPMLVLKGKLLDISKRANVKTSFLSLTHTPRYANAIVILEG